MEANDSDEPSMVIITVTKVTKTDQESNAGISAEVMTIALAYFVTVSMLIRTAI